VVCTAGSAPVVGTPAPTVTRAGGADALAAAEELPPPAGEALALADDPAERLAEGAAVGLAGGWALVLADRETSA
jgi:hypothetical protein